MRISSKDYHDGKVEIILLMFAFESWNVAGLCCSINKLIDVSTTKASNYRARKLCNTSLEHF